MAKTNDAFEQKDQSNNLNVRQKSFQKVSGHGNIYKENDDGMEEAGQCESLWCPSTLSCCLGFLCPFGWLCSCSILDERQESVLLNWGQYVGTIKNPGIYWLNPYGMETRKISTANKSVELGDVKVVDSSGSPLRISGVVTYRIENAKRAVLHVDDPDEFVRTQALSVMKNVTSKYPYDILKMGDEVINDQLIGQLQDRITRAGVVVVNFELTDLAYAKEIAQAMLIKQQAEKIVDARKIIVDGACYIAHEAILTLEKKGMKFDDQTQIKLVSNLLVAICADTGVQPTIPLD